MELLYFLPIILESIDFHKFSFQPAFSPISLGTFVMWIYGYLHNNRYYLQNRITTAYVIIVIGLFLSGALTESPSNDISRAIAFIIGILASVGFASLIFKKGYVKKLYMFFLAMNIYWVYYVVELFLSGKVSVDYHFNSFNQSTETVNSHTVGIAISVSVIYLFHFYSSLGGIKNILIAIALLGASIFAMMIAQTRSNIAFTILIASIIILLKLNKKINKKLNVPQLIMSFGVFLLLISYVPKIASSFGDSESSIVKRFDVKNEEYQTSTTNSRKLVYFAFVDRLTKELFGTGIVRSKLYLGTEETTNLLMHNQYATWGVAGGWISLLGAIMLVVSLVTYFSRFFSLYVGLENEVSSLNLAILVYFITLFTVEQSGIFFFVFSGLLIYQQTILFSKTT
jgi:hypothetical protein